MSAMELLALFLTVVLLSTVVAVARAVIQDGYGSRTPPGSHRARDDDAPYSRRLG